MVVILFLLTVVGFVAVDVILRRRKEAVETGAVLEPSGLIPLLSGAELPGGLFVHSGHTWAKLDPSGAVQVGLDGFAQKILGKVDRYELPAPGAKVRQGEVAFAALQGGKRIEFVSPVDGEVCGVNEGINADPGAARCEPYGKGWAFSIRPSSLSANLRKLRIGSEAAEWLSKEVRSFTEFLSLYRAIPREVGVTLADGGLHVDGVMETMDGEILKIAIRKYFR